MTHEQQDDRGITERAAEWLGILETASPEQKAAFAAWLKESPRHVEEFLYITALSREFTGFEPGASVEPSSAPSSVVPFVAQDSAAADTTDVPHTRTKRSYALYGLAAAIAACAILTGRWILKDQASGWKAYTTAIGEQRAFELSDGSLVHLNTHSKIEVRLSEKARDVRLMAGEALFRVARDSARSFNVHAGSTVIQALGTQFNVYRRLDDTQVSVIEGKVGVFADGWQKKDTPAISTPVSQEKFPPPSAVRRILGPGDQIRISPSGQITQPTKVDTAEAIAWRQRRLVFRTERLQDIVEEFNRYNEKPQIRIEGSEIKERRLTGVFDADDPESLVQFLTKNSDLQFETRASELIVRLR